MCLVVDMCTCVYVYVYGFVCFCTALYYYQLQKIYNIIKARGGSSYDNRLRTATEQNVFTNIQFISKKGKLKKCRSARDSVRL